MIVITVCVWCAFQLHVCVNDFCLLRSPLNLMDNSENHLQNDSESPVIATLTVGTKFQSFTELKNALDCFQRANFCQFYVRDSRTLQQARKFSPKLIQTVPEELKYNFVNYSCIHGGRCFKSRPKTGTRPQQM